MSEDTHPYGTPPDRAPDGASDDENGALDALDVVLHRTASRHARPADWNALFAAAEREPLVWRRFAQTVRDDDVLGAALERETEVADRIAISTSRNRTLLRGIAPWSGWFAAAAVAAFWFQAGTLRDPTATPGGPGSAHTPPARGAPMQPAVVGTLPAVMVGTSPAKDGNGFEVLYVNPTLERVRVNDLYRLGEDENGNPAPLPMRLVSAQQEDL